jgi:hypothetical protein
LEDTQIQTINNKNKMALRLACKRFVAVQQQSVAHSATNVAKMVTIRSFAAAAPAIPFDPTVPATVFDKMINLTIVDPSGARRKIKGMVGTFVCLLRRNFVVVHSKVGYYLSLFIICCRMVNAFNYSLSHTHNMLLLVVHILCM